jgi:hypothetical protein
MIATRAADRCIVSKSVRHRTWRCHTARRTESLLIRLACSSRPRERHQKYVGPVEEWQKVGVFAIAGRSAARPDAVLVDESRE